MVIQIWDNYKYNYNIYNFYFKISSTSSNNSFTLLNTSEKQDEAYLCSSSNTKISIFQSCLITVLIISTVELNNNPHWSNCNCHCIFKLSVGTTINTFKLLYLDNTDFKHLSAVIVFDYVIVRLFILTSYYY